MLSSPYPVPVLRIWDSSMAGAYIAGTAAGVWVIVAPPQSYEGIGATLTAIWGWMLALGFGTALAALAARRYQVELPGLVMGAGGVAIYDYLSWHQVITEAPGAGPRALLLILIIGLLVARIALLLFIDRQARKRKRMREAIG